MSSIPALSAEYSQLLAFRIGTDAPYVSSTSKAMIVPSAPSPKLLVVRDTPLPQVSDCGLSMCRNSRSVVEGDADSGVRVLATLVLKELLDLLPDLREG